MSFSQTFRQGSRDPSPFRPAIAKSFQGRGDVADLLGRFHKIDPAKAETLRRAVRDATGEDLPFRVAPLGEGFRELTDEEKLARAPKTPFGSAHGADRWAAGNMAEVLLGKGDYADAIKHFRTDQSATMSYLAAVHERMRDKNPMQAMKFATQMQKAGLAMAAEQTAQAPAQDPPSPPTPPVTQAPTPPTTPAPTEPPPAPTPEPTPDPTRPPETTQPPSPKPSLPTPSGQGGKDTPAVPASGKTVSAEFLDAIYSAEQGGKVGGERRPDEVGTGSSEKGKYQINDEGLRDIGWKERPREVDGRSRQAWH